MVVSKYQKRISGPLFDRFDIHVEVPRYAPPEVCKFCVLDKAGKALMQSAMNQLLLSARAYHRVLKLARMITDLAGSENIGPTH